MNMFATAIHSFIHVSGEDGATMEEIAHHLGLTPQLVGETLTGLKDSFHIVPTDETRDCGLLPASTVWKATLQ